MTPTFNFSLDKPDFDNLEVDRQLQEGRIDKADAEFLRNVLKEALVNPEVIRAVILYRMRLSDGLKPGRDLFVRMQELGCKNHPLTDLNIDGYEIPEVDLFQSKIGGSLSMINTKVNGEVCLGLAEADGFYINGLEAYELDLRMAYVGIVIADRAKIQRLNNGGLKAHTISNREMEIGEKL